MVIVVRAAGGNVIGQKKFFWGRFFEGRVFGRRFLGGGFFGSLSGESLGRWVVGS